MTKQRRIDKLDARWVPVLARRLRDTLDLPQRLPTSARELHALDERCTRSGALGYIREVPQLAFVAVALVLVAATLAALGLTGGTPAHPDRTTGAFGSLAPSALRTCPLGLAADGTAYVGPATAAPLARYAAGRRRLLIQCAQNAPHALALAVVSLDGPATPDAAAALFGDTTVLQVFVTLPTAPSMPRLLPLTAAGAASAASLPAGSGGPELPAAIRAAFVAAATQFADDEGLQVSQADSITSSDPILLAGKNDFLSAARADRAQETALRDACRCVYGALVEATLQQLLSLNDPGVRLVDLAPVGALPAGVTGRPLLPSERSRIGTAAPPTPVVAGSL